MNYLHDHIMAVAEVPVDDIDARPHQPRRGAPDIDGLARSIVEQGLIQPVLVRPAGERYELIDGERRWRAARQVGMRTIPALVQPLDDRNAEIVALISNTFRLPWTVIDEADAYQHLHQRGMTHEQLASLIGHPPERISQRLDLLRLPSPIIHLLETGGISETSASALLRIEDLECGQGRPFRLPSTNMRVLGPRRKMQHYDPRAPYQGPDGVTRLLIGLSLPHQSERDIQRKFRNPDERVQTACQLFFDAVYPGDRRWEEVAFVVAAMATQEQWSSDKLIKEIESAERRYQRDRARFNREAEVARAETRAEATGRNAPQRSSSHTSRLLRRPRSYEMALAELPETERKIAKQMIDQTKGRGGQRVKAECAHALARLTGPQRRAFLELANADDRVREYAFALLLGKPMPVSSRIRGLEGAARSLGYANPADGEDELDERVANCQRELQTLIDEARATEEAIRRWTAARLGFTLND